MNVCALAGESVLAKIEHIAVTIGALGTFVVASTTARLWWHRFTRQMDYRLARRLLTAVYHVRDGIKGSRNGALLFLFGTATWCHDGPNAEMTKELSSSLKRIQQQLFRDSSRAHSLMLEAEAVWGSGFVDARSALTSVLAQATVEIAKWQAQAGQLPRNAKQIIQEYQGIINTEGLDMSSDKLLVELDAAVDVYTSLLRGKIQYRSSRE